MKNKTQTVRPSVLITPFVIKSNTERGVEIRLFGRKGGATDWSIAALTDEAARKPTDAAARAFNLLQSAAAAARVPTRVPTIYAPRPSEFNAKICRSDELRTVFATNHDSMVEADFPDNWDLAVHRGVNADGCDVPRRSAFWLSSADCPCILAYAPRSGHLICAHAGRYSLVDRVWLKTGAASREHPSVVSAIVARFAKMGDKPGDITYFITCGISPKNFKHPADDPQQGESNARIIKWALSISWDCVHGDVRAGCLDLTQIIILQFASLGIPPTRGGSDWIDTYGDTDRQGQHKWWSYERAKDCGETADLLKRNGVMVIHR